MSSWLARSLASSLKPDGDDYCDDDNSNIGAAAERSSDDAHGRGVKEDLSELTETLTRQFWGVASFLAPPPPPPPPIPLSSGRLRRQPDPPGVSGTIHGDLVEIGGRLRTGISRLSNNAAVSEISKIASTFLPFGSEEEEEELEDDDGEESGWTYDVTAVGLTDEVLAFARNISMHPETWLDFPLFYDFEDCDDFDMSDAQQEHALAVEHLLPRLAALRIELCPTHMTEGCFWKIYFVLLHSRLNKHDAKLLSTPQIVEAKAMLLQRLQSQTKLESEMGNSRRNMDVTSERPESNLHYESRSAKTWTFEDYEMERHPLDKPVVEEEPSIQFKNKDNPGDALGVSIQNYNDDDDGDEWLEEESRELGASGAADIPLIDQEDVSFSDLEDDDDCCMPTRDTRQWLQLNKSSDDPGKSTSSAHTKPREANDLEDDFDSFMRQ